ncbi:MAG: CPBP family intramembrane metalloprotease [Myxococcales bacterium]|nr:MAG: CPBP family intramembrane metalloprotease [Myxococcales bacterium]
MSLRPRRLLGLALLAWLACFQVLRTMGTWTPFAFIGVGLAALGVYSRAVPRASLRPSLASCSLGVLGGAGMVLLTHVIYGWVVALAPAVGVATQQLLQRLDLGGFPAASRATLICVIASCEEILFRGLLPQGSAPPVAGLRRPQPRELSRVAIFTAAYALTTAPLQSSLLMLCALVCGSVWALMRVATGSLVVPILAHAIWDLGVLLIWPLPAGPTG